MIRVLVLIAITGFLVGVVSLSAAVGIGGPELAARGWRWSVVDWWDSGDARHRGWGDGHRADGPPASRDIAWDGASQLVLNLPAEVIYTQAEGPGRVTIRGPQGLVDKVTLSNGRLDVASGVHRGRLEITVTAPNVTTFEANGDDRLEIRNYDQERLNLVIHGSAEADVQGRAKRAEVEVQGSGDADLDDLVLDEAKVDVSGSGEVSIAPRLVAELDISGSGEVSLGSRPGQMRSQVSGSGRIVQMDGSDAPPAPPAAPSPPAPPAKPATPT